MAEVLQFDKKPEAPPVRGGFVMTPTAQNILRSLDLVTSCFSGITLIAAAPGVGKTKALFEFKDMRSGSIILTAVDGEGGPWGVACQLMQLLDMGVPNGRNLMAERRRIGEAIGLDGFLLIDEAQYLARRNSRGADDWSAFDWLRAMSEEGGFSLAFAGDLSLLELSEKRPGLWRRAGQGRRLLLRHVERGDVEALATARGISDRTSVEAMYQVAHREGGLGYVETIINHARKMGGGARITPQHIAAAISYLNLDGKGGK